MQTLKDDVCAPVVEKYLAPVLKDSNLDLEMRQWISALALASLKELIARFSKQDLTPESLVAEAVKAMELNQKSVLGHIKTLDASYSFACKKGCSYCCHSHLLVMPHEAITIFLNMLTLLDSAAIARVRRHCRSVASIWDESRSSLLVANYFTACPFLKDDTCQIYHLRPLSCRNWFSQSVDACRQSFNSKRAVSVPQTAIVLHLKDVVYASHAALWEFAGADGNMVSLFTAMDALFENCDVVLEEWSGGKPFPGRVIDLR